MRKLLIILSLTLTANYCYSQFVFSNDNAFETWDSVIYKMTDSAFHLKHDNEFEFRLWILDSKGWPQLFILTNNSNKWAARLFTSTGYPDTGKIIEQPINNKNLNKLWTQLEKNEILTIRDWDSLRDNKGHKISVGGNGRRAYVFELLTEKNKRNYFSYCPEKSIEAYPYIREFKLVLKLIKLIYKYCNIPFTDIC